MSTITHRDRYIDSAIVQFLGLGSVMDIMLVVDTGYKYEIILENGDKKYADTVPIRKLAKVIKSKRISDRLKRLK